MSERLFSPSWYRVANLRPTVRSQVRWIRHSYRGQPWHLTQDLASGLFLRLNQQAYYVVSLLDGRRSMEEIWFLVQERWADDAPTQQDVIQLLNQLHQAHLLLTDQAPDVQTLNRTARESRKTQWRQYLTNPMSIKLPLIDPDKWLKRQAQWLPMQVWHLLPWLWGLFMLASLIQLGVQWDSITHNMAARVFTPESLLMLWLIFPVTKLIHEWGHGLALRVLGGRCHEMGLMFLVLVPVPYVDASSSAALSSKWQRMLVAGAGMMAELTLAALALWLLPHTQPSPLQALLHLTILVAGVTTVFFNANPLLRFDGYHMLADVLEIPNLGQKSTRLWLHLLKSRLLRLHEDRPPALARGEAPWLLCYGVASLIYRMVITVGIIWFVAEHYFFVGGLLALWVAWSFVGLPMTRLIQYLHHDPHLQGQRIKSWSITLFTAGLAGALAVLLPVPSSTLVEGVIWMPEQSRVRTPYACFGAQVLAQPGQEVQAGQPLLSCIEPNLDTQLSESYAKVRELEARYDRAQARDRVQWLLAREELRQQRHVTNVLQQKRDELVVASPHAGRFNMVAAADFPGKYVERGELLAHILDPARFSLLAVVPQTQVDLVRQQTQRIEIRSADRIMELIQAHITREVPAATQDLPSVALALQGGGQIGLDPNQSSAISNASAGSGAKALNPLFQFELAFDNGAKPLFLGGRVHVKFIHPNETLARQLYRSVRQTFIKRMAI